MELELGLKEKERRRTEINSLHDIRHSEKQVPDCDAHAGACDSFVPVPSDREGTRRRDGGQKGHADCVEDGAEQDDVDEWDAAF